MTLFSTAADEEVMSVAHLRKDEDEEDSAGDEAEADEQGRSDDE